MKSLFIIPFLMFTLGSFSQYVPEEIEDNNEKVPESKRTEESKNIDKIDEENMAMTIGLFTNGSLIGFDLELLTTDKIGLQFGAGLIGFGGSLNFHFKSNIRSSFVGMQYIHQGLGGNHVQSLVGPHYTFRGKRWFTFSAGLAYRIIDGPSLPSQFQDTHIMLTVNIGGYFAF